VDISHTSQGDFPISRVVTSTQVYIVFHIFVLFFFFLFH
jgi:hypothetical protein